MTSSQIRIYSHWFDDLLVLKPDSVLFRLWYSRKGYYKSVSVGQYSTWRCNMSAVAIIIHSTHGQVLCYHWWSTTPGFNTALQLERQSFHHITFSFDRWQVTAYFSWHLVNQLAVGKIRFQSTSKTCPENWTVKSSPVSMFSFFPGLVSVSGLAWIPSAYMFVIIWRWEWDRRRATDQVLSKGVCCSTSKCVCGLAVGTSKDYWLTISSAGD